MLSELVHDIWAAYKVEKHEEVIQPGHLDHSPPDVESEADEYP